MSRKVAWFHQCPAPWNTGRLLPSCLQGWLCILKKIGEWQFSPEEYIYRAGEVAHEMFFVVSGSVEELSEKPDKKVRNTMRTCFFKQISWMRHGFLCGVNHTLRKNDHLIQIHMHHSSSCTLNSTYTSKIRTIFVDCREGLKKSSDSYNAVEAPEN